MISVKMIKMMRVMYTFGFTDDDRILIENLYIFKGYNVRKLIKEYPDKQITEYLNILPDCFASFFLASCDVVLKKLYRFRYRDICAHVITQRKEYTSLLQV